MNDRLKSLLALLGGTKASDGRYVGPDQYTIELAKATAFVEIAIALERIAFAEERKAGPTP